MDIDKLIKIYEKRKETIRKKYILRSRLCFSGINMALEYSELFDRIIKEVYHTIIKEFFGKSSIPNVAIFAYGSPGRKEMVSESDADIFIVSRNKSKKLTKFKNKFKEYLRKFNFCKLDIPSWGLLKEMENHAKISITEGNQVLETRFIVGDINIKKALDRIKSKYLNRNRMIRNIVFQKFYFDSYFKQRTKNGFINIKYCNGGTRDFLFFSWFDQLMSERIPTWNKSRRDSSIKNSIINLRKNKVINNSEYLKLIKAVDFIILLRSEILRLNRETNENGLTFLDKKTLKRIYSNLSLFIKYHNIKSSGELLQKTIQYVKSIDSIKQRIWNLTLEEAFNSKNKLIQFKSAEQFNYNLAIENKILKTNDLLINIALIWGANKSDNPNAIFQLANKLKQSKEWEIIASLSFTPLCPKNILHYFSTYSAKKEGFRYILRILGRNPSVWKKTLRSIAMNPILEKRYTLPAKIALLEGNENANHQV